MFMPPRILGTMRSEKEEEKKSRNKMLLKLSWTEKLLYNNKCFKVSLEKNKAESKKAKKKNGKIILKNILV